jgi:3-hydroxybutyrate dehydrogenase
MTSPGTTSPATTAQGNVQQGNSLEGKVALVTGSTGGIGRAIARALARQKASIVIHGLGDPVKTERFRASLEAESGVRVVYIGANLEKADEAVQLVEQATKTFGKLDILINNAGAIHAAPIESHSPEQWDSVMAINLSAAFHTTRTVLPQMRARNWGRIVNISSAYGLVGGVDRSSYIASKFGLIGLTKAVAMETANAAITCNAVCPGFVASPHIKRAIQESSAKEGISLEEAEARHVSYVMPAGKALQPEQIAEVVGFLCSHAAAEIRGAAWSVDGGWTAR